MFKVAVNSFLWNFLTQDVPISEKKSLTVATIKPESTTVFATPSRSFYNQNPFHRIVTETPLSTLVNITLTLFYQTKSCIEMEI